MTPADRRRHQHEDRRMTASRDNPAGAWTPGPWRIAGKGTIRAGEYNWIASINWKNRDANACLIAAAPDLYAALADMLAAHPLCSHPIGQPGSPARREQDSQRAAVIQARAALRLAHPADQGGRDG